MKNWKKAVALIVALCIALSAAACGSSSGFVGNWVAEEKVAGYPDQMALKADGTATCDGITANWAEQDGKLIFTWLLGHYEYDYKLEGLKLYLDGHGYRRR